MCLMKILIYGLALIQGFVFERRNQRKRIKGNKEMDTVSRCCFDGARIQPLCEVIKRVYRREIPLKEIIMKHRSL